MLVTFIQLINVSRAAFRECLQNCEVGETETSVLYSNLQNVKNKTYYNMSNSPLNPKGNELCVPSTVTCKNLRTVPRTGWVFLCFPGQHQLTSLSLLWRSSVLCEVRTQFYALFV
jgi:hypothetical protein